MKYYVQVINQDIYNNIKTGILGSDSGVESKYTSKYVDIHLYSSFFAYAYFFYTSPYASC